MSSDSEGEGPLFPPGEAAPAHCQQGDATYTIRFPSQSSYQCPCCKTWYNLLSSLRRHVRVSHPELALRDLFVCDVCGSEADSLKQITSHVKSTHGAIAPPASANGAFPCTYCALRFHSKVSLSQHVRGRHMEEACKVRAEASASENATEKRKAWTHEEVERFKAALIRFGPLSNVAIADAVGTRTNKQVGVFKRAFLMKNPDWISANAPPQTPPPLSRSTALPGSDLADAIFAISSNSAASSPSHQGNVLSGSGPLCDDPSSSPRQGSISIMPLGDTSLLNDVSGPSATLRCTPPLAPSPPCQDVVCPPVSTPLPASLPPSPSVVDAHAAALLPPSGVVVPVSEPLSPPVSPSVFASLVDAPPFVPLSRSGLSPTACTPIPPIDLDDLDTSLRLPFLNDLSPFVSRVLGQFEWIAFEETLRRWSIAIHTTTSTQQRPCRPCPSSGWSRRTRARPRNNGAPPTQESDDAPDDTETSAHHRASGWLRRAAKASACQRLYRRNPRECIRRLLTDTPPVYCAIPEADLSAHFTATYSAPPPLPPPPAWLYDDSVTTTDGDVLTEAFRPEEILHQLSRFKRSAPGADGITYATWRWVDPAGAILAAICNICRVNLRVPSSWKGAQVILIHKGGDTNTVRNWRPICLQLTLYKLYTALLANRIASWATQHSSFSSAQKGFLAYDGCAEHNFVLQAIMTDSRRKKRDLLLTWLDLRDAFGSVPHDLLLSSMQRFGLSGSILTIVEDIYTGSSISVRTGKTSFTPPIPQRRGVKQGCPLSPILFNIALEGMLRHLEESAIGYPIAGHLITSLAYADDVCIAATSKTNLQTLLDRCLEFSSWAGLAFNAKKCGSLCSIASKSPIFVDPTFTPRLGSETIPALHWNQRYKYLGCPSGASRRDALSDLTALRSTLLKDSTTIFQSDLAEWQKLDAFRRFLFPRVTFILKVLYPDITWCDKLDTSLRSIVKKGIRLPARTCTDFLYLSQDLGGLGLPSVADTAHVAKACQAFKFLSDMRDPIVRAIALDQLAAACAKRARSLDPRNVANLSSFLNTAPMLGEGKRGDLRSIWSSVRSSLSFAGATISISVNTALLNTESRTLGWENRKLASYHLNLHVANQCLLRLQNHVDQGRAFHSICQHPDSSFFTFTGQFLSFYQYRFVHKARTNLLPVRTVQARCRRLVPSLQCRVCGRMPETLSHVLNHCLPAMDLIRARHNSIVDRIVRAVPAHLGKIFREQPPPGTPRVTIGPTLPLYHTMTLLPSLLMSRAHLRVHHLPSRMLPRPSWTNMNLFDRPCSSATSLYRYILL